MGPSAKVLALTGNKSARDPRQRRVKPVCPSSPRLRRLHPSTSWCRRRRIWVFPLFIKRGCRGRGPRDATGQPGPTRCPKRIEAASSRRPSPWRSGDPTVYLEQAVINPRHIEVQILADTHGKVIHLFERDCSVQRRHQKVVELAPAPNLAPRNCGPKICADAVAFAPPPSASSLRGTVEFLLDERGHYVFTEMNPASRSSTPVRPRRSPTSDLVSSQLRIAGGETLEGFGLAARGHPAARRARCSAASPPKTRPTASGRTPDESAPTVPGRGGHSGWTAAPTWARRSAHTSIPCWSS